MSIYVHLNELCPPCLTTRLNHLEKRPLNLSDGWPEPCAGCIEKASAARFQQAAREAATRFVNDLFGRTP